MEFICIQQCYREEQLWDVGMEKVTEEGDKTDWSKPTKKGERICWKRIDKGIEDAVMGEKKTVREITAMRKEDLILYAQARYKGTIIDPDMTNKNIRAYIKELEEAKDEEDTIGLNHDY